MAERVSRRPDFAPQRAAVAAGFDAAAEDYDRAWGTNPVGLHFRHVVHERLAALFPARARVLDLGCGTGEDAVFLAERGVTVGAIDMSAAMLDVARAKAQARGVAGSIRFERGAVEDLAPFEPHWDGAFSNFGALNCADLGAVARRLAALLRAGAPVVVCVMRAAPLPSLFEQALCGTGVRRADGPVNVAGTPVPVHYPTLSALREAFGRSFRWRRAFALGVCIPGPEHGRWAQEHPQTFGLLAMAERLVRAVPVLRGLGDHVVLEGVRA